MGTPARQGHVQRVEHQFGTKVIGHRPSHDALSANITETVRRARRPYLAGANPARQLSLQPVAVGAAEGGNDLG